MRYLYLIPEEVRNAKLIRDELAEVSAAASSNWAYLCWNFLVLILGAGIGLLCAKFVDNDVLNAVIAFDGVIIGFVITAMLFSGRSQFLTKLSYEQVLLYAQKTRYMLLSQMNTLFSFLACLIFSVLSMISLKSGYVDKQTVVVLAASFFILGCYRIILLPFQIYDIHSFALDNLIADSADSVAGNVKSKTEERLRLLG
uniref:Uncharacterized protein n=1 Tax=Pseudomonas graminis TaxID=158627 RepID=A0A7C2B9A6_9PSED